MALFIVLGLKAGQAQGPGDAQSGFVYADKYCAVCHEIKKGKMLSPNPEAPSFQSIADTPGITGIALTVALQTPHRAMPDLVTPQENREDVIAYILSLKDKD